jgi:ATP-dependent Clp protease ATP-binding subunit ClpX
MEVARKAAKRETGARALRAVMEEIMLHLLYELPEYSKDGSEYILDESAVLKPRTLGELRVKRKESA